MKKLHLILILVLLAFGFSCKKNNDTTVQADISSSRIKKMTVTDSVYQIYLCETYQYDEQGRILKMIYDTKPEWDDSIHIFEYYPDKVIEKVFYQNFTGYGKNIYTLNSDGMAISEKDLWLTQAGDSSVSQTVFYKYNADGFMIEKKTFRYGDTTEWILEQWQIANGNISSITASDFNSGGMSSVTNYEYYSNTINSLAYINQGRSFFGKSSSNLIKSYVKNYSTPVTMTITYSYDSMGRVIKEITEENPYPFTDESIVTIEYY